MSGKLVLVRHGESEWNLAGKWTGWTDVSITEKGAKDAQKMGELLKNIHFDKIYTSKLKRTIETMQNVLKTQGQAGADFTEAAAINERNYGDYTGLNKWDVKAKVGEEKFNAIRRDYDEPIPNGETLHDVYDRAVPWYLETVVPELLDGENVLLVGHGNSMRALVKYLDGISDADIAHFEFTFGTILIYTIKDDGTAATREELHTEITQTKA
jgi:2,3-bisphosphoglycerate-dependent phosphoglycerate mutase